MRAYASSTIQARRLPRWPFLAGLSAFAAATTAALQGRGVMEGFGLDPEKDFEAIYTANLAKGPHMILEGRASALWGAGNRWPGLVKIASDARGARFIAPDDAS